MLPRCLAVPSIMRSRPQTTTPSWTNGGRRGGRHWLLAPAPLLLLLRGLRKGKYQLALGLLLEVAVAPCCWVQ